jgi:hypothetical protein
MSILSNLQTKKLGLLELIAMSFDLYLTHFLEFLIFPCIILIFTIIEKSIASNLILSIPFQIFLYLVFLPIYSIVFAIFTEKRILGEKLQLSILIRRSLPLIIPSIGLHAKYLISVFLRSLLFIVPGIIYLVNNNFCILAFVLRDQRGKAAFQYSRSLVKGNWWKVFFFHLIILATTFGLLVLINNILSSIITNSPILLAILSDTLGSLVLIGFGISGILIFLNLDFQKQ